MPVQKENLARLACETKALLPPPLFLTLSGAHLYGWADDESDWDVRGCHYGDIEQVLGLQHPPQTVSNTFEGQLGEVDVVSHELGKFCRLLCKPNGNLLEQIYSPHVIFENDAMAELRELAKDVICKKLFFHYRGFWEQQHKRYSKGPHKKLRQLLYQFRVLMTGMHVLLSGHVVADIRDLIETHSVGGRGQLSVGLLMRRKRDGQWLDEMAEATIARVILPTLVERLEYAHENSTLPDKPRTDRINEWLVEQRLEQIQERWPE